MGFNLMLDWDVLLVDAAAAAADAANNELNVVRLMMNDSLFRFRFGHSQPILEVPGERVPFGMGPCGFISSNVVAAALQIAHVVTNGMPSVREFFDVRLRKARPRHIQSEQNFTAELLWPNGAVTLGTTSGGEYYRVMVYAVGILLSAL